MAQRKNTNILNFIIISLCILVPQLIAYFATPVSTNFLNFMALYAMLVQWIAFIHASGFFGNKRTERYYDLIGGVTLLSSLAISLNYFNGKIDRRRVILSSMTAVWSTRLGLFLYLRCRENNGVDSRFTPVKESLLRFLTNWSLQGMWAFNSMLPILILNQSNVSVNLGVFDFIGIPLWIAGFLFEVIADYQKITWRKSIGNKNKFINIGLWTISRHPNYFGEILLWIGISLSAYGGLVNTTPRALFVFWSPISVALLLIYISGIPILEKSSDQKFGKDKEYQRYKKTTSVLIPFIGRKEDAMF